MLSDGIEDAFSLIVVSLLHGATMVLPLALLAVLLVLLLGRQLSASTRAWLWWLVCAKLLVGLFWVGSVALPILPPETAAMQASASEATASSEATDTGTSTAAATATEQSADSPATATAASETPGDSAAAATATSEDSNPSLLLGRFSVVDVMAVVWGVGVIPGLLIAIWQFARVRRLITRARPTQDPALTALIVDLAVKMDLPHAPFLLVLEDEDVDPFATGLRRPVVVFSRTDLDRFSEEELRLVLAHEMAHLKRGDLWLGLVPLAAKIVFWFWPVAYWAARAYDNARETACDEAALRGTGARPSALGRLLTALGVPPTRAAGAAALTVASPHFKLLARRLKALERYAPSRARARRALVAGGVTFAVALAAGVPWQLVAAAPRDGGDLSFAARKRAPKPVNMDFTKGIEGWSLVEAEGDNRGFTGPVHYTATPDTRAEAPGGRPAVRIAAKKLDASPNSTFILGQNVNGQVLAGKRVRFSAWMKSEKLKGGAGLWIRQDAAEWQKNWAYNADLGSLEGNTPWKQYSIVFDIPEGGKGVAFGFEKEGAGSLWVSDVHLEAVDANTPLTPASWDSRGPAFTGLAQPDLTNGGFEEGLKGWRLLPSEFNSGAPKGSAIAAETQSASVRSGKGGAQMVQARGNGEADWSLAQQVVMEQYAGKTMRLTAYLRTEDVTGGGTGLWIRIDGDASCKAWNVKSNVLNGTTADWRRVEYTLHVPKDARVAEIGINLIGPGRVWVDDVTLTQVTDASVKPDKPDFDR